MKRSIAPLVFIALFASAPLAFAQTVAPPNSQPEPKLSTGKAGSPPRDAASAALDNKMDHGTEFGPMDSNSDGWLSADEINAKRNEPVDFASADTDGNGRVTKEEWVNYADGQDPALQDAQDR